MKKQNNAEIAHELEPSRNFSGNGEKQRKTIRALRYAVVALILGIIIAAIAEAANVIVKNGQLNATSNVYLGGGSGLFVDS